MRQRLAMLAVVLYAALGSAAHAHHSHFYDECKSIAIEVRVERVEFKSPLPPFGQGAGAEEAGGWVK